MGLLATIFSKVFGKAETPAAAEHPATVPAPPEPPLPGGAAAVPVTSANPAPAVIPPVAPAPEATVDVAAMLDGLAVGNSEDLDWRKSIVDLLKLIGMDSSLTARKELAAELGYPGDTGDSAAMNVWLHKQVMQKLAENGGKVPAELLD